MVNDPNLYSRDNDHWKEEIYECIEDLKTSTRSAGLNLYWLDQELNLITLKQSGIHSFEECSLLIDDETNLVALAAKSKKVIFVKCTQELSETKPQIAFTPDARSIICAPIMSFQGQVLLVLEIYRIEGEKDIYSKIALDFTLELSKWFSIWLSQRIESNREENMTNFHNTLSEFVLKYFNEGSSYEEFLSQFLKYSKEHIKADQFYLYDYDNESGFCDVYQQAGEDISKTGSRLKMTKLDSFYCQVRESKIPMTVQIGDGFAKLDKEIVEDPENPIRNLLYYPLMFGERFLGVVVFAKTEKSANQFTHFTTDEQLYVSRMAALLADALVYRYIVQEMERRAARTEILRETFFNLLQARLRPEFVILGNLTAPKHIHHFDWELTDMNNPNQLTYVSKMFQATYRFDSDRLKAFLQCVQIAHNNYPYHNIKTTFHITRTVYCLIDKIGGKLRAYEKAALMIAAVTLYCGHNGLDNHVMLREKHPLTKIYKTYMKENHRVWNLKLLLDQTKFLDDNKEKDLIVNTANLLLLKPKKYESPIFREKIRNMIDTKTFNMANEIHRQYALLVILRIGVHGRHMQPFNVAKKLRDSYYEEMLTLGELERQRGYNFHERKNREMHFKISNFEIDYIKNSVLPTLDLLRRIFPEANIPMKIPADILQAHELLVGAGNKKLWDPETVLGCSKHPYFY